MKNLYSFCFLFFLIGGVLHTSAQKNGIFTTSTDVGKVQLKGSTSWDNDQQVYTLKGSGLNMWAKADAFHIAAVKMNGDCILTTFCQFEGKGVVLHRKMGLIIRESLDPGSRYADAAVHGDGLTSLQYRSDDNAETQEIKSTLTAPEVIQLERKGDTIIMRCAHKGDQLTETGRLILHFRSPVYVGLFVCSHDTAVMETARFRNFRIDLPAAENVDGYKQPSASRLELLNTETGDRRVIYSTTDHIEAPNWSRDGKFLIYNSNGLLYKFPLSTGKPEKINTGQVTSCNNDHGLSFDGKMLAISSNGKQADGRSGSMVFTVPVEGGIPKAITPKVPSYWHGWSPDGKTLVYCAERNGDYNIWGIPSSGGEEFQLTTAPGLDDGPEYAPDGKYIYFNSVRSGMMKIWRMKPDGKDQQQVSFGQLNDWFAHLSPDGKKMVYISYPATEPANAHTHNKRVLLQIQNTNSKDARVLAYIYGGQGTLNVPSWSPDNKTIAFVSYTYGDPNY